MKLLGARFLVAITLLSQICVSGHAESASRSPASVRQCLEIFTFSEMSENLAHYGAVTAVEGESIRNLNGLFQAYYSEMAYSEALVVAQHMLAIAPKNFFSRRNYELAQQAWVTPRGQKLSKK
jgi:hypothetical protein